MDPDAVRDAARVPHGGSDDPDVLDFSANVNPRIPDGVCEVYSAALDDAARYPNDAYPDYRAAAAGYVDCDAERVVPTPGGLAGIRLAVETCVEPGDSVLVPYPSFGEYAREVELRAPTGVRPHDELLDADPRATRWPSSAIRTIRPATPPTQTPSVSSPRAVGAPARNCSQTRRSSGSPTTPRSRARKASSSRAR